VYSLYIVCAADLLSTCSLYSVGCCSKLIDAKSPAVLVTSTNQRATRHTLLSEVCGCFFLDAQTRHGHVEVEVEVEVEHHVTRAHATSIHRAPARLCLYLKPSALPQYFKPRDWLLLVSSSRRDFGCVDENNARESRVKSDDGSSATETRFSRASDGAVSRPLRCDNARTRLVPAHRVQTATDRRPRLRMWPLWPPPRRCGLLGRFPADSPFAVRTLEIMRSHSFYTTGNSACPTALPTFARWRQWQSLDVVGTAQRVEGMAANAA